MEWRQVARYRLNAAHQLSLLATYLPPPIRNRSETFQRMRLTAQTPSPNVQALPSPLLLNTIGQLGVFARFSSPPPSDRRRNGPEISGL